MLISGESPDPVLSKLRSILISHGLWRRSHDTCLSTLYLSGTSILLTIIQGRFRAPIFQNEAVVGVEVFFFQRLMFAFFSCFWNKRTTIDASLNLVLVYYILSCQWVQFRFSTHKLLNSVLVHNISVLIFKNFCKQHQRIYNMSSWCPGTNSKKFIKMNKEVFSLSFIFINNI